MYRKVLDILILFHSEATEHVGECPLLENRIFDYAYLSWETDYFAENFRQTVCKIPSGTISGLSDEFLLLATTVGSFRKTIIHRDFQSQNIMVTAGNIPKVLDYQGARMAPPAYDVVSILWDPYSRLDDALRERLLDYYVGKMSFSNPALSPFPQGRQRGIPSAEFCPWGIATQRPDLVARLDPSLASVNVVNLIHAWTLELSELMGAAGINSMESLRGNRDLLRGYLLDEGIMQVLDVKPVGA